MRTICVFACSLGFLIGFSNAESGQPYISLDSCDFLIPEGYYVNSGSIREDAVTLRSTRTGDEFGSVRIRFGISSASSEAMGGDFQFRVVQENHAEHFSYSVISVQLPGEKDHRDLVRVETDAYTLVVSGHAMAIWKDHLICPALPFAESDLE